jgi:hypothetical protein
MTLQNVSLVLQCTQFFNFYINKCGFQYAIANKLKTYRPSPLTIPLTPSRPGLIYSNYSIQSGYYGWVADAKN